MLESSGILRERADVWVPEEGLWQAQGFGEQGLESRFLSGKEGLCIES